MLESNAEDEEAARPAGFRGCWFNIKHPFLFIIYQLGVCFFMFRIWGVQALRFGVGDSEIEVWGLSNMDWGFESSARVQQRLHALRVPGVRFGCWGLSG